ncbi:MAG: hypothetical protein NTZ48_07655 [Candidatus Omnitrophica bacterium]|nr:hypothetical protein [Candidatus Omnitrophota bacterium]
MTDNLIIPTSWNGRDGKKDYESIVNGNTEEKEEKILNPSTKKFDTNDFIYVPSIDLYVAKQRTHLNKNWFDCHKLLQGNNERMLIVPEFVEFLKYLKNSNNQEYLEIYKDITEVRNPWRAEYLDADFKVKDKKLYVNYNHILDANGNLIPKNSEVLDKETLMSDKTPGISLDDFLESNHTNQGFPNKKVKSGNLYYWNPRSDNNSVAGFSAGSGGASLDCGRDPSDGVRISGYVRVRFCPLEV